MRLKSIIETAIDGIIIIDQYGTIESINPAAARLFGYEQNEVIGKNVRMLMPSPYRQEHDGYLKNYLETKKPKIIGIGREVQGMKKDGSIFPIRLAVSEVGSSERRLFTGIIHDMTDIKEAQAEIQTLNQDLEKRVAERTETLAEVVNRLIYTNSQLQHEIKERRKTETVLVEREEALKASLEKEKELNALKSRFVSMASHEFRTPLSTILSSIELIEAYRQPEKQEKRQKHIGRIKTAVTNLNNILNDFLSLSRLEEGRIHNEPVEFLFNNFCEETIDEIRGILKKKQKLHHQGLEGNPSIYLDKKILKIILFNLLSNAIKYSYEGKNIFCRTRISENKLTIEIQDEGIGIPEEDHQHLFTRFFRAHNVENIQGTGLGLNIVKRYVELIGGEIYFESALGEGSTFYVKIPLENPQA